jgi:hypothetical protein
MSKTIVDKLNLQKYPTKLVLNCPADIEELNGLEFDTSIQKDQYDLIFTFIYHVEDFTKILKDVIERNLLKDKGYLYFAYPKKGNRQYQEYIERDSIFPEVKPDDDGYVFGSQVKFARMVSLNDVFTIVGFKSEKKKVASSKKSQCVDDYIMHVVDIKNHLEKNEELLNIYNNLTPGYQKDWARYVFSAAKKETQEKRLLEMETVLAEGYKTMDLYKRQKK